MCQSGTHPELEPSNSIRQYVFNEKGQPIGMLLAYTPFPEIADFSVGRILSALNGKYVIGFCQLKEGDSFNKKLGTDLAQRRAKALEGRKPHLQPPIAKALPAFVARCERFFKGKAGPSWVRPYLIGGQKNEPADLGLDSNSSV